MSHQRDPQNQPNFEYEETDLSGRDALEKVINETLNENPSRPMDPASVQQLCSIAKRHADQDLSIQPILVELVEAILQDRVEQANLSTNYSRKMSLEIANSLFSTPASQKRLIRFWNALVEAAR